MTRLAAAILQIFILLLIVMFAPPYSNTISVAATNDSDSKFSISAMENLSNDEGQSRNPQLAMSDTNVYVAWHNEFYSESNDAQGSTQQNILFRKGSDYGKSFSKVTSLADDGVAGGIHPVRFATSGTSVYVAWNNGSGISDHGTISSNEVFLRSSIDCGEMPFRNSVVLSSSNSTKMTVAEPPELAAYGTFVYTVWSMNNWEDGTTELFFKRSMDNGVIFEKTVNLTDEDSLSNASVVSRTVNADANLFDVIWTGYNGTGDKGVFLKRSLDYGETFTKTIPIYVHGSDGNVGIAGDPSVASSNGNLFVVWRDNYYGPSGNFIIYFSAIAPGDGENLGDVITISDKTREATSPQIAVFENNVYIVWEDRTNPENTEIFFRASTDGGKTFGKIVNLSNTSSHSYYARIAASDSAVFVVWSDESVGNGDIILRISTDTGATFEEPINLSNNSGWSASPQIVAPKFTDLAFVVWQDGSPGNLDIFFRTIGNSQNNSRNSVADLMLTEIELSPSESDELGQWIEVHNPTNKTLGGVFTIRQPACQEPSFIISSAQVKPDEYLVIEIFDKDRLANREGFPTENTTLSLWVGPSEAYRTTPLHDTVADSRTWQLNGTEWVFANQTPTKTIPEFGSAYIPIIMAMAIIAINTIALGRMHLWKWNK